MARQLDPEAVEMDIGNARLRPNSVHCKRWSPGCKHTRKDVHDHRPVPRRRAARLSALYPHAQRRRRRRLSLPLLLIGQQVGVCQHDAVPATGTPVVSFSASMMQHSSA